VNVKGKGKVSATPMNAGE